MKTEAPRRRRKYETAEEADEVWKDYLKKYVKTHQTNIQIRLNNERDADVIERIKSRENKADYIRMLVRDDMRRENKKR